LKAVHHILASSAETIGAFNTGLDTVNLHRPTVAMATPVSGTEKCVAPAVKLVPLCSGAS